MILFGIKPIERDALVGTDPGCPVRHRMGIDPVILHVDFCAGNKEGSCLMNGIKSPEIDIAAIHDVDGPGLWRDEIESQSIAHFTVVNMDKTRYRSTQIKQCVHFYRGLVERKSAHGNSERHKLIVVLSSA